MEKLVNYTVEMISAVWIQRGRLESLGYTEFEVYGTDENGRRLIIFSCPFRLDIFDAESEELIKLRCGDEIQEENYKMHAEMWRETCKPFAEAICAAFAALKG